MTSTLFVDRSSGRTYWLPAGTVVASGPLRLHGLDGTERRVDPVAVAAHEVSEVRARELAAAELEAVTTQVTAAFGTLGALIGSLAKAAADVPGAPPPPAAPAGPDAAAILRDTAEVVQVVGDAVARTRDPGAAREILEDAGALEQLRAMTERLRAATAEIKRSSS